jgi:hypothetical protein
MTTFVLQLCAIGATIGASAVPLHDDSRAAFEQWKREFRPSADEWSADEESARFGCFREAVAEANELNRRLGDSAEFGLNDRSDICPSDSTDHPPGITEDDSLTPRLPSSRLGSLVPEATVPLEGIDWREKGAVLPFVKNQGRCGSCWSFGSSANMEAVWFLHSGKLLDLSEQELVSCARAVNGSAYPKGCQGGSGATHSYSWVILNGGLDTTADYGNYTSGIAGQNGECHYRKLKDNAAGPFSSYLVLPKNETAMAQWVSTKGPLSVHIDAKGWNSCEPLQALAISLLSLSWQLVGDTGNNLFPLTVHGFPLRAID